MVHPLVMHSIDKHVGRLLCSLLTVHRKVRDGISPPETIPLPPTRILCIKFTEQGSLLLAYAAIQKAVALVGRDNVHVFVSRECRQLLALIDVLPAANIIEFDMRSLWRVISSLGAGLKAVRDKKIDAAVDLEFFARASAIFAYLSGARIRVGVHRFNAEGPYRGDVFTHRVQYNPHVHAKFFFLGLVNALTSVPRGEHAPPVFEQPLAMDDSPLWQPRETEKAALRATIETRCGHPLRAPAIIFNPKLNDVLPLRRWPPEKYVALGRAIRAAFPQATIIITGLADEQAAAAAMARQIPGAFSLAGETTLSELLTLYHLADVLVTSDSGPAHFSSLTPIHCIILFGPETPALYGPTGPRRTAVTSRLACSPCLQVYNQRTSRCPHAECMDRISVAEIFQLLQQMLSLG